MMSAILASQKTEWPATIALAGVEVGMYAGLRLRVADLMFGYRCRPVESSSCHKMPCFPITRFRHPR